MFFESSAGRSRSELSLTGLGLRPPFSLPLPRAPSPPSLRASRPCSPLLVSSSRRGGRIPSLDGEAAPGTWTRLASLRPVSPLLHSTRLDSTQLDSTRFVSFPSRPPRFSLPRLAKASTRGPAIPRTVTRARSARIRRGGSG